MNHLRRVLASVTLLVLAGNAIVLVADAHTPEDERVVAATTTTTTSTTTTSTTTTTTAPVALPEPAVSPRNGRSGAVGPIVGRIEIPKLGLAVDMREGINLPTIDKGPSHWPGTAMPGEPGNVVIAGHRVTNTRPFRHIDTMVPGDEVIFEVAGARHRYRMVRNEIVTPKGMHIIEQTPERTATLFACHPPGSARYRYVVHLAYDGPA